MNVFYIHYLKQMYPKFYHQNYRVDKKMSKIFMSSSNSILSILKINLYIFFFILDKIYDIRQ